MASLSRDVTARVCERGSLAWKNYFSCFLPRVTRATHCTAEIRKTVGLGDCDRAREQNQVPGLTCKLETYYE